MANGDTKTESYLRVAAEGSRADLPSDTCCNTKTQNLILGVANRIMDVEDEVEELKNNPDVADIVDTYADLQAYDTQHLTDNDIVRVLTDEQHDGQSTYYRFTKNPDTWTYIGAVGDYYTKGQVDDLLDDKQNVLTAGANIQISAQNEISATDTTYTHFTGATASADGTQGLVPGPLAGDEDKFLKADGTWAIAGGGGGGPTVVQTTGTSTIDVMSQDATTKLIYPDIANNPYKQVIGEGSIAGTDRGLAINGTLNTGLNDNSIAIGAPDGNGAQIGANGRANGSVAIGSLASVVRGMHSVAIGAGAGTNSGQNMGDNVALGRSTNAGMGYATSTVALGAYAQASRTGEVNIGTGTSGTGYNSTNYRVIGGVHDGVDAHDAATVGQLSYRQKKPVTVWEVDGTTVTTGLIGVGEDISANPNWQLTDLDLTPFARIKIYSKAAQKAGTTASASTTPAIVLEMSLDSRAAIAEYGGNYVGSIVAQKPNDANRLCTLCCAVSADKTKFEVLRMTNLYGTAATSNSDVNAYVFKIEGYYE